MYLCFKPSKPHRCRKYLSPQILTSCDIPGVGGIWPKRCAVVSKASLKFIGPLGLIIWLSRTITIDRSHHSDAISTMDKAAEAAKRDQVSVCIFPEGTRSDADNLLPFKKGAFHMAIKCQVISYITF